MEKKAKKVVAKTLAIVKHPHASIRGKFLFGMFRGMQLSPEASWNPKDKNWWIEQGWTKDIRPWKK